MTNQQRQMFPYMPEEIFDSWIDARFISYGWTYPTGNGDISGWSRKFGEHTLRQLADFHWTKTLCHLKDINDVSIHSAHGVIGAVVYGNLTEFAKVERTKQRFWACANFIRKNCSIPGSLAGIKKRGVIDVLDGCHRLAALIYLAEMKERVPNDIPICLAAAS